MFKVKVNGREIAFTFRHEFNSIPVEIKPGILIKATTTASVDNGKGTVIYGVSQCSFSDNFDKDKGRKLALAKALKDSGIDYNERSAIWNRYHNRYISDEEYEVLSSDLNEL